MCSEYSYNFCILNLVLVVYTQMSIIPIQFILSALESSVQMDLSGSILATAPIPIDASAVAVYQVSVADMRALFQFQTDSYDVTDLDATDIKYYVNPGSFPAFNPVNSMMDATDSSGAIALTTAGGANLASDKMLVAHDFVRYLAQQLFNTYLGVDLFNNEVALLNSLRSICDDSAATHTWFDIKTSLDLVGVSGTHADIDGSAGQKYMTNSNNTAENLCRVLFEQMTSTDIARFATVVGQDTPQDLPFHEGDSISFKLNISPADGQEALTGLASAINARSYEIRMELFDTPVNTTVAGDETA